MELGGLTVGRGKRERGRAVCWVCEGVLPSSPVLYMRCTYHTPPEAFWVENTYDVMQSQHSKLAIHNLVQVFDTIE